MIEAEIIEVKTVEEVKRPLIDKSIHGKTCYICSRPTMMLRLKTLREEEKETTVNICEKCENVHFTPLPEKQPLEKFQEMIKENAIFAGNKIKEGALKAWSFIKKEIES